MEPSDTTNSTIFVGDDTMNSTSGDMGNEGRNSKMGPIEFAKVLLNIQSGAAYSLLQIPCVLAEFRASLPPRSAAI